MMIRTIAAIVLFASLGLVAQSQTRAGRAYEGLVDRLFAVSDDGVYILRFVASSFEPEMQVVFSVPFQDGDCSAKVWHLPADEAPLVVRLLDRIIADRSLAPDALYEGLVAVQTTVTVPCNGELARRMQAIDDISIPLPRDYSVAVHGMSYRLEIRKGATRLRFQTHAGALSESYDDPLLSWMAFIGRSFRDAVRQNRP